MRNEVKNLPASVHDRLKRLARERGRPFQEIFYYYSIERFLYRLSKSQYASNFVLKGGLMFIGWGIQLRRPTRDIDVQGYLGNTIENLENTVKEICGQDVEPDGMLFDANSVRGEQIMDEADYKGIRIFFSCYLGKSNIQLHFDVSFANVITPKDIIIEYPSLLGLPEFKIHGYTYETAIAEKFQSMIVLSSLNSRIKDFYDIWLLSQQVNFVGSTLVSAINATFSTRNTALPNNTPTALTPEFGQSRQLDWDRFLRRSILDPSEHPPFVEVISILYEFLWPVVYAAKNNVTFNKIWNAGGPWSQDRVLPYKQ